MRVRTLPRRRREDAKDRIPKSEISTKAASSVPAMLPRPAATPDLRRRERGRPEAGDLPPAH
jgi:hypothetical protein